MANKKKHTEVLELASEMFLFTEGRFTFFLLLCTSLPVLAGGAPPRTVSWQF